MESGNIRRHEESDAPLAAASSTLALDPPDRIIVKEVNWLGDLVMSLPAMRAVRRAWPSAHLAVLVKKELASFFDGAHWIDEVIPYCGRARSWRALSIGARSSARFARDVSTSRCCCPTVSSRRCGSRWRESGGAPDTSRRARRDADAEGGAAARRARRAPGALLARDGARDPRRRRRCADDYALDCPRSHRDGCASGWRRIVGGRMRR